MLPRLLCQLSTRVDGDRLVPNYLSERDEPWLRALLEEHARFAGRKQAELRDRLREPLPVRAPKAKLRLATYVLEALTADKVRSRSALRPREARRLVFGAAAAARRPRAEVLGTVAASLELAPEALEAALFADLKSERCVPELPADLSPARLALQVNHALVTSLLRRAHDVRIAVWGHTRALVRQARLLGLICVVTEAPPRRHGGAAPALEGVDAVAPAPPQGAVLDISGPFALFRRTELYGRALASLLPRLGWCHDFELEAACALGRGGHLTRVLVRAGDPIQVGRELGRYDSKLEERFARDFQRAAPDWDLIREPSPVAVEGTLIFPDFEIVHRHRSSDRWLLEVAGFWTPEYLAQKLRRLRAAKLERFILCIDERLGCGEADLPANAQVIRYRSRIQPDDVLRILDGR